MRTYRLGKQMLMVAMVSAFGCLMSIAKANADCLPAPAQQEPVTWNGAPPMYVDRDTESCRLYWYEAFQEPGFVLYFWHEIAQDTIRYWLDIGYRVVTTDRPVAGTKVAVTEFFNIGLNHYFLALPDEAQAIEDGNAGIGWRRTGYSFTARRANNSPLSNSVYRFYGSLQPGPNSHFFTIANNEASALTELAKVTPGDQPRWNYEGIAFNAFRDTGGGTCGVGKMPVWRVFNGGYLRGVESNHRYSTDKNVLDGMVGQGWIAEGVAFCADVLL